MPVRSNLDLSDAAPWVRELGQEVSVAAVRGLQSAAFLGLNRLLTQIIPSRSPQPVDRGLYRAGWRVITSPDGADIENNEPHAAFIEDGVRGSNVKVGRLMIQALTEWVTRKGLAQGTEAVSAAWAIAQSMKRRGIFNAYAGSSALGGLRILAELNTMLPGIIQDEVMREIKALV